jgi:hypothetical protein
MLSKSLLSYLSFNFYLRLTGMFKIGSDGPIDTFSSSPDYFSLLVSIEAMLSDRLLLLSSLFGTA